MSSSQASQIIEYCKKGLTEQLLESLADGQQSDIVDDRNNSLLSIALYSGHWATFSALIENHIKHVSSAPLLISACQYKKDDPTGITLALAENDDINIQNINQRTALMTACLLGHIKKVEQLIESGADATLQDATGNTALMEAVQSQNKKIVEALLKSKINVDQNNKKGETALIVAVQPKKTNDDIIKLLLDAGANPEKPDNNKKSAWLIAKQRHSKISRMIEQHLNNINQIELPIFNQQSETTDTENHDQSIEEQAQQQKDNMQENTTTEGQTQNQPASTEAPVEITTQDIDKEQHVDEVTVVDPQISAVKNTDINTLKQQIVINEKEWFRSAKIGNLGGLNRMIIAGIDVNCTDDQGCTALIRASGNAKRAVVSFLLQNNADIEKRSDNGSTALSSSIIGNCHRVAGLLLEKKADAKALGPANYPYITIAAAQWSDGMLSLLSRYGADILIENHKQQNLMHIAALAAEHSHKISNAKTTFQFLQEHGIDINSVDHKGHTALMLLCGAHQKKYQAKDSEIASIVHSLIKLGAAAAMTNQAGKSAFDAAVHHKLLHTKGVLMNALSWNDA